MSPNTKGGRRAFCLWAGGMAMGRGAVALTSSAAGDEALSGWTEQFAREVDHLIEVPQVHQQGYIVLLEQALSEGSDAAVAGQSVVLVDRSPQVQAAMVLVRTQAGGWHWLGATAVSTGKTGTFEHFLTPLGVFAHTLDNPYFRAEGTLNKNHIRGYGLRGRRVLDPRLGDVASEGCIRIPATLNVLLDVHGVLDADYEAAVARGDKFWILKVPRQTIPWPGRYMVIVDSQVTERPFWSPLPTTPGMKPIPAPPSAPTSAHAIRSPLKAFR